jgi:hypothetical protein
MNDETAEHDKRSGRSKSLHLTMGPGADSAFVELLQKGFLFECQVGVNIESFLCQGLGLEKQYVLQRISTIFLDGRCVDDIDSAIVKEGSTLALSAAMPGLAGASLRRGGVYGAIRSSITHNGKARHKKETGLCSVKLFNLLITELGPVFLQHGILIKTDDMEAFLKKRSEEFRQRCRQIILEGKPVDLKSLLDHCRRCEGDFLLLTADTEM